MTIVILPSWEKYPRDLSELYDLNYFQKPTEPGVGADAGIGYQAYQAIKYDYFSWAIALVSLTGVKGSLFDLGCANGLFLDLARAYGFDHLSGLEFNGEYARLSRDKGYQVYEGDFLALDLTELGRFDVLTAWAVLEHIPGLNKTLEQIKQLLKPDGLFFFEVPCLTFDQSDDYWLTTSLEHVSYFTPKSIRTILRHFFGSDPVVRLVQLNGFGSTLVGFINPDSTRMNRLASVERYLSGLTRAELAEIKPEHLKDYLIFYLRYLEDFATAALIVRQLNNQTNTVTHDLSSYYLAYLTDRYIAAQTNERAYLEAKDFLANQLAQRDKNEMAARQEADETKAYFLTQLDNRDRQLAQARLAEQESKSYFEAQIENYQQAVKDQKEYLEFKDQELARLQPALEQTQQHLQWHQEELAARDREVTRLRGKDQELARLQPALEQTQQHLQWHQEELAARDREVAWLREVVEVKDHQLNHSRYEAWVREVDLNNLRAGRLYRLKEAVLTDPLSARKFLRIGYLLLAMVTPRPLEQALRPLVAPVRRRLLAPPRPVTTVTQLVKQGEWPSDKPLVSVVIPCYNYGEYVEQAIDSVLNQTFQGFEIIVVDDGSDDVHTLDVLGRLDRPKTRLIRQPNQGVTRSRNNGIKQAQGKYICCLDADDLLHPTYLEKCLVRLETENLDICYSWLKEFEDGDYLYRSGEFELETLMHENTVIVSAVFKRRLWQQVGGLKATGYEDWEFWLSLAEAGARGARLEEPLFLYRKHGHSRINYLTERHANNVRELRKIHHRLYRRPQEVLSEVRSKRKTYVVKKAYANLIQPPYHHWPRPSKTIAPRLERSSPTSGGPANAVGPAVYYYWRGG